MRLFTILIVTLICLSPATAWAQRGQKPKRAVPPQFTGKEFEGTFFSDVSSVLQGPRPTGDSALATGASGAMKSSSMDASTKGSSSGEASSEDAWNKLISASTLEDTIKNSKLRLDALAASKSKFDGAFKEARREYSLQALMFAVIEDYPGEVRWKKSAALARAAFIASPKAAPDRAHQNAKERLQDLNDLFSGNALEGSAPAKLDWGNVIERIPLMQLLEWAQGSYINPHSASKENFAQNKEELQRYAELVSVLGKAAIMPGMSEADDPEYRKLGQQMIDAAKQITLAVQTDNADMARAAAGQLGQSCTKCHDGYR